MRLLTVFSLSILCWSIPSWNCSSVPLHAQPPAIETHPPASEIQPPAKETGVAATQDTNWAQEFIADDPLVVQDVITLDDIQKGLDSAPRRSSVIDRHFRRVQATNVEKQDFLLTALKSEFAEVQRQAARELASLGLLESVVRELLLEFILSEDPALREAAVIALQQFDFGARDLPEAYWSALIEGLATEDPDVLRGIATRLESQGASAVPALLAALRSSNVHVQRQAARILSNIVGSEPIKSSASADQSQAVPTPNSAPTSVPMQLPSSSDEAKPKSPSAAATDHSYREPEVAKPNRVQVYFGTNRQAFNPEQPAWSQLLLYPVIALLLVLGVFFDWWHPRETKRRGCTSLFMTTLVVIGIFWTLVVFRAELLDRWRIGTGPRFGPRRDPSALVHYGICDVSIPPNHQVGQVETPLLGPEDEDIHVVLQKTQELDEAAFFKAVRDKTASLPKDQRSCFVFIHGFNVTFENAAKRTAQIHFDLKFSGVPIFFSWPSRASVRHYFSDRNEIDFSRHVIKQFLLDVSQRVQAERIHVIAHSMGADATCRAIAELGDQGKIFDQIILAAPDIDRDVFRVQIAPRMIRAANRTTMYCSKNDWALLASNAFNDAPRAGDSRENVLVIKEVDTVDASGIDTDLLGHSYYGDCLPILNDVRQLVSLDLPPEKRKLRPWPVDNELIYWTMPDWQDTAKAEAADKVDQQNSPSTPE